MKTVDPVRWAQASKQAHAYKAEHRGQMANAEVRRLAAWLEITNRAFRRKLKHKPRSERRRWQLDGRRLALIAKTGSVRAAAKEDAAAVDARSKWTWYRAWRALPPAVRVGLKKTEDDMRDLLVYNTEIADEVNEQWQLDTSFPALDTPELQAWRRLSDAEKLFMPRPDLWVFVGTDAKSHRITCWGIGLVHPNGADVLEAVAEGIRRYGAPIRIRWDNALEQIGRAITGGIKRMLVEDVKPSYPYSPWQKGKVERLNGTQKTEVFRLLPGWRGRPSSPLTMMRGGRHPDEGQPETLEQIRTEFAAWVKFYNESRPHSSLGGLAPDAFCATEIYEVRQPSDAAIALALLARGEERTVGKDGIGYLGQTFNHWKLSDVGKETVLVVPDRNDPKLLFVTYRDDFVCVAKDIRFLTKHEIHAIASHREKIVRTVREALGGAAKSRDRHPATRPQEPSKVDEEAALDQLLKLDDDPDE